MDLKLIKMSLAKSFSLWLRCSAIIIVIIALNGRPILEGVCDVDRLIQSCEDLGKTGPTLAFRLRFRTRALVYRSVRFAGQICSYVGSILPNSFIDAESKNLSQDMVLVVEVIFMVGVVVVAAVRREKYLNSAESQNVESTKKLLMNESQKNADNETTETIERMEKGQTDNSSAQYTTIIEADPDACLVQPSNESVVYQTFDLIDGVLVPSKTFTAADHCDQLDIIHD